MKVFKYSVIGNNTASNREWLEKLGYTPLAFFLNKDYIYTNSTQWANHKEEWVEHHFETHDGVNTSLGGVEFIDCRNSDELFRAVTAMRDDSDYMQWFCSSVTKIFPKPIDWTLCKRDKWGLFNLRKAKLEELIEYFK